MAKLQETIKVDVVNTDAVLTMIELLNKHKDSLPQELVDSLCELADCEHLEINNDTVSSLNRDKMSIICDGVEVRGVTNINPILKRLTVYPSIFFGDDCLPPITSDKSELVEAKVYPESFEFKCDGKILAAW